VWITKHAEIIRKIKFFLKAQWLIRQQAEVTCEPERTQA